MVFPKKAAAYFISSSCTQEFTIWSSTRVAGDRDYLLHCLLAHKQSLKQINKHAHTHQNHTAWKHPYVESHYHTSLLSPRRCILALNACAVLPVLSDWHTGLCSFAFDVFTLCTHVQSKVFPWNLFRCNMCLVHIYFTTQFPWRRLAPSNPLPQLGTHCWSFWRDLLLTAVKGCHVFLYMLGIMQQQRGPHSLQPRYINTFITSHPRQVNGNRFHIT